MADSDLQQFMHELLARFENLARGMTRVIGEQTAVIGEQTAVLGEQTAVLRAQSTLLLKQGRTMEDISDKLRAHEQALLHILDHLRRADGTT